MGAALIFLTSIRVAFLLTVFILAATFLLNFLPWFKHRKEIKVGQSFQSEEITVLVTEMENRGGKLRTVFYAGALALAAVSSGVLFTFFAPYARSLGISILLVGVITFVYGMGRFSFYVLTTNERVRSLLLRSDRRVRNMLLALVMTSVSGLFISLKDSFGEYLSGAYAVVGVGISIVLAIGQAGLIAESGADSKGRGAGSLNQRSEWGLARDLSSGGPISGSSLAVPFLVPPAGFLIFLALSRTFSEVPVESQVLYFSTKLGCSRNGHEVDCGELDCLLLQY